ncbi:hypothetical protein [Kluyvera chengduensis]|uniref:hypothetical protein n=1 Tax=Kluyvera sp. 142359 TaxID=3375726 RepID=UPI003771500C
MDGEYRLFGDKTRNRASAGSPCCDAERVETDALLYGDNSEKFAPEHTSWQLSKSAGFGVKVSFIFRCGL